MFTGLIETVGEVTELKPTPGGLRVRVRTALAPELETGDSVAINGVCLTVVSSEGQEMHSDVSPETARVTSLASMKLGALVNIERALTLNGRLGGHFVQGHVDATGTIEDLREEGDTYWLTVQYPPILAPYIVRKGSIAVDGISLTVAGLDKSHFDLQIVPHTWHNTNLRGARPRDLVNIECDILGKYVVRVAELAGLNLQPPASRKGH